ncbi:MAG TPA: hypothetical protein VF818_06890 [Ktedonobacterales bacterium]
MTPDQEAFLARARDRLRELEALRDDAHDGLTSDDFVEVDRELLQRIDDVHGAITQALRGLPATLNARPATRYTVYRLDVTAGQWLRVLTTRDVSTAVRHLMEQQGSGEIAHVVAWLSIGDRAAQERDAGRFRPQLTVADARDHVVRL